MKILVLGLSCFCSSFLVHLILWRVKLPCKQGKALFLTFFGIFLLDILILYLISKTDFYHAYFILQKPSEYLHIAFLYVSLTCAYIVTYPAIEVDSPSLVIVNAVANSGHGGLKEEDLRKGLTNEILVKPRLSDLVLGKMVCYDGDKLKITRKGILFITPFIMYRRLVGAKKGG